MTGGHPEEWHTSRPLSISSIHLRMGCTFNFATLVVLGLVIDGPAIAYRVVEFRVKVAAIRPTTGSSLFLQPATTLACFGHAPTIFQRGKFSSGSLSLGKSWNVTGT